MSVSVVIPTYNSAALVTQAIDSLLAQTVPPDQIVVVDDGSTDDTPARLAQYRGQVEALRQSNRGVSAARNLGVTQATGDYVAFLDADDVWHPRKNELQLRAFGQNANLGLLGTHSFPWPTATVPLVAPEVTLELAPIRWEQLVVRNALTTSSVLVRRDLLRQAGPFDCTMQGPEDRDLWLRVAHLAPVANLTLPLVGYRDLPGSVSKQAARCQAGMLRILQKLDENRAWNGRVLLRQKAYSYVYHACACIWAEGAYDARAVWNSLQALAYYPLPYGSTETAVRLERPRRLPANVLRLCGLKPPLAVGVSHD